MQRSVACSIVDQVGTLLGNRLLNIVYDFFLIELPCILVWVIHDAPTSARCEKCVNRGVYTANFTFESKHLRAPLRSPDLLVNV